MEMSSRFRGFLPVVVDIETGGFDSNNNAILEIAMVHVRFKENRLVLDGRWCRAVDPFPGSTMEEAALKVTGIDPDNPDRGSAPEGEVIRDMFANVRSEIRHHGCQRAVMVAHNAAFVQQFLAAAVKRVAHKRSPFHPFSFIDTASLAAVAYGHNVLSEACARADISFDPDKAHSALYDAERTAELFCSVVNQHPISSFRD